MAEDALGRIEFGRGCRQRELDEVIGPDAVLGTMTPTAVQHDTDPLGPDSLTQRIEEGLEAGAIHPRHEQEHALARTRLDRRIQPAPLVVVLDDPWWSDLRRTPPPTKPDLEPEATFINGPGAAAVVVAERRAEVSFCTRPASPDPPAGAAACRSLAEHGGDVVGPRRH